MPLQKLQFRPGVNRENTTYAGEGGWYDCDKVRFRSGYPEKIGGWQNINANYTFKGVCRKLWNWITLNSNNLAALGTDVKLYVENGGAYYDITPIASTASPINNNPFATTNGSRIVTVSDTAHGQVVNTYVTFSGASTPVGGIDFNAEFEIIKIIDANSYVISAPSAATSTTTGGGASVVATYQLSAGNPVAASGAAWGVGGWGRDGWGEEFSGTAAASDPYQIRLWSLDNYGQDLVAAVRGGSIYYWEADTTVTPPRAVTLATKADAAGWDGDYVPHQVYEVHTSGVQRFAIAVGANPYTPGDPNTDLDPMLVRWSDQENVFNWVPSATNQAGEIRLSHGSRLVTGVHSRQEFIIWSDSAVYSLQYLGPPYVWGVTLLMDGISIASPNATTGASNIIFWMGTDKFYMYDGRVQTLPCSVRQYVFDDINSSQYAQIVCGGVEQFSEVWWFYPSANSLINDRYVVYNYLENVWYYGRLERTTWLDSSLREKPMGVFSTRSTYTTASLTSNATTVAVYDAVTYPSAGTVLIDSEQITYTSRTDISLQGCVRGANGTSAAAHDAGARITLTIPNQIMYHETGNDDASTTVPSPITAYISSSDFDIGDGHNFGFVWRIIPDLTFDSSSTPSPNYPSVTMVCKPRQNSGTAYSAPDSPAVTSIQSYATQRVYTVQQFTGQVYTRIRGRQMTFEIRSTDLGVAWQLGTPRIDIRPDGRR
jgi:hypothetical protein